MDSFFFAAHGNQGGQYHARDAVYVSPTHSQLLWPVQREHDAQQPEHPEYCIEPPQPAGPQYSLFCDPQWGAHQPYAGDMLHQDVATPLQPYWPQAGHFEDAPIHPPPLGSSAQRYSYTAEPLPVRELSQQQDSFRPERSSSLWGALDLRAGSDLPTSTQLAPKLQKTIPQPLHIPSSSSPRELSEMSPLTPQEPSSTTSSTKPSTSSSSRSRSRATGKRASTATSTGVGPERKAALLACHFCRGRKIACGGPLAPESVDKSCNQCSRRKISCTYPADSHRGVRRGSEKRLNSLNTGTGPVVPPSTTVGSD